MNQTTEFEIETRGLRKEFSGFVALNGVSLKVRRGSIHALLGPNGAGKTTLFNLITRFAEPSGGRIYFRGRDITADHPARLANLGIARSFQISAVFVHLDAFENVLLALHRRHGRGLAFWQDIKSLRHLEPRALELLKSVGLSQFARTRAGELSYGRKRALELATTLALDPAVLLLDEPMAGISHADIDRITDLIRMAAENRTVLMVEHNLGVVAKICDRITVMCRGEILTEGSYEEVSCQPQVIEAYMGKRRHAA